jgi:hypothetical protein
MKKIFVLVLITALSFVDGAESVAYAPVAATTTDTQLNANPERTERRRRNRQQRQRRGFMWGLFKKKSPCGCPNH